MSKAPRLQTFLRLAAGIALASALVAQGAEPIPVLIVDGRSNHDWATLTPLLRKELEKAALFRVDVTTAPPENSAMSAFEPPFARYRVVALNYTDLGNGGVWPEQVQRAFVQYVKGGGGVIVFHAALSAFPHWKEFNQIIGLGGWAGRDEHSGPYVYYREGKLVRDESPGTGGHHGPRHPFEIVVRKADHAITKGLPQAWMHAPDELYEHLRGPAEGMDVLTTAYSDPALGGTGHDEPMLFTVRYGKGRVVCIATGHGDAADAPDGAAILQRSAEWAATGRVTQPVPKTFLTATH